MTTETKRDLSADLALCNAATPGPWHAQETGDVWQLFGGLHGNMQLVKAPKHGTNYAEYWPEEADAKFIAESREGWPESIRRAIAAEAEVVRLRAVLAQIATYGGIDMRGSTCAQTAKDALGSSPPVFDDVTESHRWLKALVSALDDGRLQQTWLSSGTDYVIRGARDCVRRLSTEVSADVGL